ncbi:RagB/SusD family nutrient uptake outer membrane protein [Pedobacter sp. MC2016-24]|nr:RagB/SusD family nutrient uptake outer membrane protein [Pedobacter sp. MC2016-24]
MKAYIYKILMIVVVLISSSCGKYLTLEPQDGIIRQEYWKTKEDVKAAVIGCYSSLLDAGLIYNLFTWGEIRGDMVAAGAGINADEQDIINVNVLPTNSLTNWSAVYRVINNCNTVIDFAPQVLTHDKTFTQSSLDAYLAEALAIRSLMYFYLVRSFRDVPLKLKSTSSDAQLENLPKSPAAAILAQIVTDLKKAELNAVSTYGTPASNKGRVTKYTTQAILADVYLWMEQYDNCILECDKLINSGQFTLVPHSSGWYTQLFYNGNSAEGIFEFQFDASGTSNPFNAFLVASKKKFIAGPATSGEFFAPDESPTPMVDIRGEDAAYNPTSFTITKYSIDNPSYVHWFAYRYADILLMKAEACAQVNRGQDALDIVTRIRERATAPVITAESPDASDAAGISDYILNERAREFAFEGKRWFDLLRNAKRNNYQRLNEIFNRVVERAVPAARQQSALAIYRDVDSHYFPINQNEINTDPALEQNNFYK